MGRTVIHPLSSKDRYILRLYFLLMVGFKDLSPPYSLSTLLYRPASPPSLTLVACDMIYSAYMLISEAGRT